MSDLAPAPGQTPAPFRFDYQPGTIRYGDGCVADLGAELDEKDLDGAVVVTGRTVGTTAAVMDPIREGLGDHLATVLAETTPDKRLSTAAEAAASLAEHDADAFVSVGGGSSLDVAKAASLVAASDRTLEALAEELAEQGTIRVPDGSLPPVVAVPTTLAGADLSQVLGISAGTDSGLDERAGGGISDRRLFPAAVFADPALVATTPLEILQASAMNGFDKGVETLLAPNATPITDATAAKGVGLLSDALPALETGGSDAYQRAVAGIVLVQYGFSRPDGSTVGLIHAFGHGMRIRGCLHQGTAHAIAAPHVLRYVFDNVDGRRDLLASAFGVDVEPLDPDEVADAVVDAVAGVRDGLGLPDRMSTVAEIDRDELPAVAKAVHEDRLIGSAPGGLEPTLDDVEAILDAAW